MPMQFSENADRMDVRYVAALARISLEDAEAAALQAQLDDILAFVGELKSLDVEGVEETQDASGTSGVHTVWREDEPRPGLDRDAALALAPHERHGQFAVPKIIE